MVPEKKDPGHGWDESNINILTDGIVILDADACIGCRFCIEVCPYDAIAFDPAKEIAQKCNLCHHRVDRGLVPACADNICPGHCIHFGDANKIHLRPMGVRTT